MNTENLLIIALIGLAALVAAVWGSWDTDNAWRGNSRRVLETPAIVQAFSEPELPDVAMFDLPANLIGERCHGCDRHLDDRAFLCPSCMQVIGMRRMHGLFQLIEHGRLERAWVESERIAKTIRDKRSAAIRN